MFSRIPGSGFREGGDLIPGGCNVIRNSVSGFMGHNGPCKGSTAKQIPKMVRISLSSHIERGERAVFPETNGHPTQVPVCTLRGSIFSFPQVLQAPACCSPWVGDPALNQPLSRQTEADTRAYGPGTWQACGASGTQLNGRRVGISKHWGWSLSAEMRDSALGRGKRQSTFSRIVSRQQAGKGQKGSLVGRSAGLNV